MERAIDGPSDTKTLFVDGSGRRSGLMSRRRDGRRRQSVRGKSILAAPELRAMQGEWARCTRIFIYLHATLVPAAAALDVRHAARAASRRDAAGRRERSIKREGRHAAPRVAQHLHCCYALPRGRPFAKHHSQFGDATSIGSNVHAATQHCTKACLDANPLARR